MSLRTSISQRFLRNDRILNAFHLVGLADATSQTVPAEFDCLARHARGRGTALEIGTRQGVAAGTIVRALDPAATLVCVDPWLRRPGGRNWSYDICMRHFDRLGVRGRIKVIRAFSHEAEAQMPAEFDFMFIDGDHSWEGIAFDWEIVLRRLRVGGIVALHDTSTPAEEPQRAPDSCRFFREVVMPDARFRHLETCYSMNVLERIG